MSSSFSCLIAYHLIRQQGQKLSGIVNCLFFSCAQWHLDLNISIEKPLRIFPCKKLFLGFFFSINVILNGAYSCVGQFRWIPILTCIYVLSFTAAAHLVHHMCFSALPLNYCTGTITEQRHRFQWSRQHRTDEGNTWILNTSSQIPFFLGLRPERKTKLGKKCSFKKYSALLHAERVPHPKSS